MANLMLYTTSLILFDVCLFCLLKLLLFNAQVECDWIILFRKLWVAVRRPKTSWVDGYNGLPLYYDNRRNKNFAFVNSDLIKMWFYVIVYIWMSGMCRMSDRRLAKQIHNMDVERFEAMVTLKMIFRLI